MKPRDIIKANIEFQCDDRIGMNFSSEGRIDDFCGVGMKQPFEPKRWTEGRMEYYYDLFGNLWHRVADMSQIGEILKPVLQDWNDLDSLVLPDLANPAWYEDARALGKAGNCGAGFQPVSTETDKFCIGWMPGWPFATCRYMRKMEIYFTDLYMERERIDILHDRVTTLLEEVIDRYGEAGLDGIMFAEDLGIQDRLLMSPAIWRDIFRPLYERLTSRAHGYGMKVIQHSCGFNWQLVDDLCGAGIDCLQFDQPAVYDMPALAKKLRQHRVGLFAPCDIQKVLPTGDRALIERETRRLVETFRGGLIAKNYPDLHGIGVEPEWDEWAYRTFIEAGGKIG